MCVRVCVCDETFDPCEHFEKSSNAKKIEKGFSIVLLAVEAFHQDLSTAAGVVYVLFSIFGGVATLFQPPLSLSLSAGAVDFLTSLPLGTLIRTELDPIKLLDGTAAVVAPILIHFSTRQFSPRQLCHFSGRKEEQVSAVCHP